jgi:hypothetical protein
MSMWEDYEKNLAELNGGGSDFLKENFNQSDFGKFYQELSSNEQNFLIARNDMMLEQSYTIEDAIYYETTGEKRDQYFELAKTLDPDRRAMLESRFNDFVGYNKDIDSHDFYAILGSYHDQSRTFKKDLVTPSVFSLGGDYKMLLKDNKFKEGNNNVIEFKDLNLGRIRGDSSLLSDLGVLAEIHNLTKEEAYDVLENPFQQDFTDKLVTVRDQNNFEQDYKAENMTDILKAVDQSRESSHVYEDILLSFESTNRNDIFDILKDNKEILGSYEAETPELQKGDYVLDTIDGKEAVIKVDAVIDEKLADATAYHEDFGFVQAALDPKKDYPEASNEKIQEFDQKYAEMVQEIESQKLQKGDYVLDVIDGKEAIVKVDAVIDGKLADATAYHEDFGFVQSALDPTKEYPEASNEKIQEFDQKFNEMVYQIDEEFSHEHEDEEIERLKNGGEIPGDEVSDDRLYDYIQEVQEREDREELESEQVSHGKIQDSKEPEHSMKGQNEHWDNVIKNIEDTQRQEKAEQQRDNHVMYGVNDHWNAVIESVALSDNQVEQIISSNNEPNKAQEAGVLNNLLGNATERAEVILNAKHHEIAETLKELTKSELGKYEGKEISAKDLTKITEQFQEKLDKVISEYAQDKSKGVSWNDRIKNVKDKLNNAVQEVKEKAAASLQTVKDIPENTKNLVKTKLLNAVVKTSQKMQTELGKIEAKLQQPESERPAVNQSKVPGKTVVSDPKNEKGTVAFSLKGVKSTDQKIKAQDKKQEQSQTKQKSMDR